MQLTKAVFLFTFLIAMLTSCDFVSNTFTYKHTTEAFAEALLKKDYSACIGYMAMERAQAKNTNLDTLKSNLASFREVIVQNFGIQLSYSFMTAEKTYSTDKAKNTPPNTTTVQVEFSNKKVFGVFNVLFDDNSHKIIDIHTLDIKASIPGMATFWLFGILPISVVLLNVYVISRIKKSNLKKKWLKYLAVICLNVPAVSYAAVNGLSVQLLTFQILLGLSFSYTGYLGSVWAFGIPLGGLYWLWRLRKIESSAEGDYEDEVLDIENVPNPGII